MEVCNYYFKLLFNINTCNYRRVMLVLKYKKEVGDSSEEISAELKECAEVIAETDERMLKIRMKIEAEGITVSK